LYTCDIRYFERQDIQDIFLNQIPVFDNSSRKNDFDCVHAERFFFSPNNILSTKSIFAPQDWKRLHNKSIVLKHGSKPHTCIWGIFLHQNIVSLNVTWIWQLSSTVPKNYYSLATRSVKWWQKTYKKLNTVFCFSCKISASEVTKIWHDSNYMLHIYIA